MLTCAVVEFIDPVSESKERERRYASDSAPILGLIGVALVLGVARNSCHVPTLASWMYVSMGMCHVAAGGVPLYLFSAYGALNYQLLVPDGLLTASDSVPILGLIGVLAGLASGRRGDRLPLPVDDRATFILMTRFMQVWLDPRRDWSPARCLAEAQRWLREEATIAVLAAYDLPIRCPSPACRRRSTGQPQQVRRRPPPQPAKNRT